MTLYLYVILNGMKWSEESYTIDSSVAALPQNDRGKSVLRMTGGDGLPRLAGKPRNDMAKPTVIPSERSERGNP